jgi:hypothetical protein
MMTTDGRLAQSWPGIRTIPQMNINYLSSLILFLTTCP